MVSLYFQFAIEGRATICGYKLVGGVKCWLMVLVEKTIRSQPWPIHIILLVFFGGSVVTFFLQTQFDHVSCIFHSWNPCIFLSFCFPMCPLPLLWEQDGFEPPNCWLLQRMHVYMSSLKRHLHKPCLFEVIIPINWIFLSIHRMLFPLS
jgi:hypothetical protein